MSEKMKNNKNAKNRRRSFSIRKMVAFNHEFRGNFLMLRQISQKFDKYKTEFSTCSLKKI